MSTLTRAHLLHLRLRVADLERAYNPDQPRINGEFAPTGATIAEHADLAHELRALQAKHGEALNGSPAAAHLERAAKAAEKVATMKPGEKAASTPKASGTKAAKGPISLISPQYKDPGYKSDPFAPIDPYHYMRIYGQENFPKALDELTHRSLKEVAIKLIASHPGTKPATMSKKSDLIAYIKSSVETDMAGKMQP